MQTQNKALKLWKISILKTEKNKLHIIPEAKTH